MKDAQVRAETAEAEAKTTKADANSVNEAAKVLQGKLKKTLDSVEAQRGKVEAYDNILAEKNSAISSLKEELAKVRRDNNTLYQGDVEAQDVIKKAQSKIVATKSEMAALCLVNEKHQ